MKERRMTMNELQQFVSAQFGSVRVVMKDEQPWFVAKDICECLEISNHRDALYRLDDDEKGCVGLTDAIGRERETSIINEYGLYSLTLTSRKPEAKAFKRWVTHEILPALRKHGAYMTEDVLAKTLEDPNYMIGILQKLADERDERKRLQFEAELNRPKVLFADAVATSETSILVGEMAKLITQKGHEHGINIGQRRLFAWLREQGYLMKSGSSKNLPTQKSMNLKLMEVKERTIVNDDGSVRLTRTPKITGKGQIYFLNKFLKSKIA